MSFWGVRGSIPAPGRGSAGFGGNTSCVYVTTSDGTQVILDAGSGIRDLGAELAGHCQRVHILLTHLHLDHIQGLMFFAPLFDPSVEVTIWGPTTVHRPLRDRLARFISDPLSPIEIRDLPARVHFNDAARPPWRIGSIEVSSALVAHRGPTLGYRLTAETGSVCYLPDHEPGLGQDLLRADPAWISGHALARGASLLIHDGQYEDAEYSRRRGWGHSSVSDAVAFVHRSGCARAVLFHHDPAHDDERLQAIAAQAADRLADLGDETPIELAREGQAIEVRS